MAGDPISGVVLRLNQHVRITEGEHAGREGFVISLLAVSPEPTYRVERMDTGFDVTVPQRALKPIE